MLAPNISPPTPEAQNFSETHSSQYLRLVIKNKQKDFCQLLAKMYLLSGQQSGRYERSCYSKAPPATCQLNIFKPLENHDCQNLTFAAK